MYSTMLVVLLTLVQAEQLILSSDYTPKDLEDLFTQALSEARIPATEKISTNLTALIRQNKNLRFDDSSRVLLVFPGLLSDYPDSEQDVTLYKDTFLSAFPELKSACAGFSSLRLLQFLGLSPTEASDGIIEAYFNLEDVFRPCSDPSISDQECELSVLFKGSNSGISEPPWICDNFPAQISSLVTISQDHLQWMCRRWSSSYLNSETYNNRPWTALGYTFDWGSDRRFGLSEFAVRMFTTAHFVAKYPIDQYCD